MSTNMTGCAIETGITNWMSPLWAEGSSILGGQIAHGWNSKYEPTSTNINCLRAIAFFSLSISQTTGSGLTVGKKRYHGHNGNKNGNGCQTNVIPKLSSSPMNRGPLWLPNLLLDRLFLTGIDIMMATRKEANKQPEWQYKLTWTNRDEARPQLARPPRNRHQHSSEKSEAWKIPQAHLTEARVSE